MKFPFVLFCWFMLIRIDVYAQHFTTIKSNEGIEISENNKKVLFYQVRPKTVDGKYERSGFVHPLYDLNEKVLTDDAPADHPYHRGVFWAWHQIIVDEKNIADGWMSDHISWKPVKTSVKRNKKRVILRSELLWDAQLAGKTTSIIKERTKITVSRATPQYRVLDFEINLFPLADNVKLGGSDDPKGYGGFCLRLKLPNDLTFISEGKSITPEETQVLAGPWMDFIGSFEGESLPKTGIAVFGYTGGSDQQYPWILRKVTSMQNVPYPGRTPAQLSKSGWRLKYRVIIHNSEMKSEDIEKLYQQYIHNRN